MFTLHFAPMGPGVTGCLRLIDDLTLSAHGACVSGCQIFIVHPRSLLFLAVFNSSLTLQCAPMGPGVNGCL